MPRRRQQSLERETNIALDDDDASQDESILSDDDEDDMLQRLAHTRQHKQPPQTRLTSKSKEKTTTIENEDDDDDERDETETKQPQQSQSQSQRAKIPQTKEEYETWKQQQAEKKPKGTRAPRVPIKVERARATREADMASGVASALQTLALKKQARARAKRERRAKHHHSSDENESEDEEDMIKDDQDQHEHENENEDGEKEEDVSDYDQQEMETEEQYRLTHDITLTGPSGAESTDPRYHPITSLTSCIHDIGVDEHLVNACMNGMERPMPIQAQAWAVLLNGRDIIGIAQTGSGKTLAFLLPAFVYIQQSYQLRWKKGNQTETSSSTEKTSTSSTETSTSASTSTSISTTDTRQLRTSQSPFVLILAPTRELTLQIGDVATRIATRIISTTTSTSTTIPFHIACIAGGMAIDEQQRALQHVDLLVATTGRLIKLIDEGHVQLGNVGFLILDEADRMLDLGFAEQLQTIMSYVPVKRQTALFSATWGDSVSTIASPWLRPNHTLTVTVGSTGHTTASTVTQIVEVIDRRGAQREKRLLSLLSTYHASRSNLIIIFVLYKREADHVAEYLNKHGWKAQSLTGDKSQTQRNLALTRFRTGEIPLLVATDVAARGIDVKNITHVINFSMGLSLDHYIHRIGRCGRAGQHGTAHTFFCTDWDAPHAPTMVKLLEQAKQNVSRELIEMSTVQSHKQIKKGAPKTGDAAYQHTPTENDDDDSEDDVFVVPGNRVRQSRTQSKQQKGRGRGRGRR